MAAYVKGIFGIALLLLFITFGVENSGHVTLNYYSGFFPVRAPLYALMYLCIAGGIIVGMVIGFSRRHKLRKELRNLESEVRDLRHQVFSQEDGTVS
jgi:uncharacterized integral membrane protein